MKPSILRLPDVKARTGLARATIYKRIADEQFPPPIHLGQRAVGWISTEIDQWIEDQITRTREGSA